MSSAVMLSGTVPTLPPRKVRLSRASNGPFQEHRCVPAYALGKEQRRQRIVRLTAWDWCRSPAQDEQGNRLASYTSLNPRAARGTAVAWPERPQGAGLLGRQRHGWAIGAVCR
eukprot:365208-Chlamydomonas_euryale.AAC.5